MTKFLNGQCQACGGSLEFPAGAVGTTAPCPHCGRPTELLLAAPPRERIVPARTIVYAALALLILLAGLVAVIIALKRAERISEQRSAPPAAATPR
jgi:uncharacterized paraquat-inducible protein A